MCLRGFHQLDRGPDPGPVMAQVVNFPRVNKGRITETAYICGHLP